MRHAIARFFILFGSFTAIFAVMRLIFIAVYASALGVGNIGDWLAIMSHGLGMDMSVAGYLTIIPALAIIAETWTNRRWPRIAADVYLGVVAAIIGLIFWLDIVLYSYWGFRLDMTPIFYFTTSPSAAMASMTFWQIAGGAVAWIATSAALWLLLSRLAGLQRIAASRSVKTTVVTALLTGALFLPIRGGVTVSTMNPSHAYFSERPGLNHAALNPAFNVLYSATHQNDYGKRFRFFDDEATADSILASAITSCEADSAALLRVERPDIVLVILESFSAHLMPSLGGEPIATGLDSIAREGVLFTDFYAGAFRTDRALPAIMSALPPQPTTSVLKYVDKIEALPSLPAILKANGYETAYYYGGDANFTNMMAYLKSMGFGKVVSDKDFAARDKASKWGAHDHKVFERAAADIIGSDNAAPRLSVVQTSSSHEPFEVPYSNPRFKDSPEKNAFAYADSALTAFVNEIKASNRWDRTLLVIVPDHRGCWPKEVDNARQGHHVPLVMAGGALDRHSATIAATGSQTDIAATLLGAMGIDAAELPFSRDLRGTTAAPAFMVDHGQVTVVYPDGFLTFDCEGGKIVGSDLPADRQPAAADLAKAHLQRLYSYLNSI